MALIAAITGFSTSGKTYISQLLDPFSFHPLVSHTTRSVRPGEFEGLDYFFTPKDSFKEISNAGGFVEEISFCGYRYGLSFNELEQALKSGKTPIHICTPEGVSALDRYAKEYGHNFVSAFVEADSTTILNRMLKRIAGAPAYREYTLGRMATALTVEQEWGGDYHYILKDSNQVATLAQFVQDYSLGKIDLPKTAARLPSPVVSESYNSILSRLESMVPNKIPHKGNECWALAEEINKELA